MNQLLNFLVQGANVIQKYRRVQHCTNEVRRQAHRLSPFTGVIIDLCLQAEFSIHRMEQEIVSYVFQGRVICMANGGDAILCFAATPFRFYTGVPREIDELLERRNSSLKYGCWGVPSIDGDHESLMFRIKIAPDILDLELFKSATAYASCEREQVEAILERAGYSRSPD